MEENHGHNHQHGESHDKHAGHDTGMFLRKFWVSLILTFFVLLYSEFPRQFFGWEAPKFFGSDFVAPVFGSIVFFYGGWVFILGAFKELKEKLPGMMTLISIAISSAYVYSIFAFFSKGPTLFWELTTLIAIMLLGHWLEMRAVGTAQGALKELSKLLPDTAEIIRGDKTEIIPLNEIREGDMVFVRPGLRIPADGIVIEGKSETNESMITGEARPVIKNIGSEVIAGTINGDGALKIKVSKVGERTFLAGVMRLVSEAQSSKSRLQMLSDRAAFYLTIIAVVSAGLTLVLWLSSKAGFGFAIERMVAVLVIACPHALGLAVPLVASISTLLASRNGFLVRQRMALETARKIDVVLFDKTGTLTQGVYGVTGIWPIKAKNENEVLQFAASVDARSEHFISKAIVRKAKEKNIFLFEVEDFNRIPGKGVKGIINGEEIFAGGLAILENSKEILPPAAGKKIEEESKEGKTIIYIIRNKEIFGVLALADLIREESREAINGLGKMGIRTAMITGDSEDVAKWVAEELKIGEYFARVLPGEKTQKIKLLQSQGYKVAMVGDGINDAPALVQADLGIAIGAGTNVAIESAGIILVRNDPRDIARIIRLSRLTYKKMLQNLFWATGYNIVALPLAAGILYSKGILLQPALAALFMSLSTMIVAFNAILLKYKKLD